MPSGPKKRRAAKKKNEENTNSTNPADEKLVAAVKLSENLSNISEDLNVKAVDVMGLKESKSVNQFAPEAPLMESDNIYRSEGAPVNLDETLSAGNKSKEHEYESVDDEINLHGSVLKSVVNKKEESGSEFVDPIILKEHLIEPSSKKPGANECPEIGESACSDQSEIVNHAVSVVKDDGKMSMEGPLQDSLKVSQNELVGLLKTLCEEGLRQIKEISMQASVVGTFLDEVERMRAMHEEGLRRFTEMYFGISLLLEKLDSVEREFCKATVQANIDINETKETVALTNNNEAVNTAKSNEHEQYLQNEFICDFGVHLEHPIADAFDNQPEDHCGFEVFVDAFSLKDEGKEVVDGFDLQDKHKKVDGSELDDEHEQVDDFEIQDEHEQGVDGFNLKYEQEHVVLDGFDFKYGHERAVDGFDLEGELLYPNEHVVDGFDLEDELLYSHEQAVDGFNLEYEQEQEVDGFDLENEHEQVVDGFDFKYQHEQAVDGFDFDGKLLYLNEQVFDGFDLEDELLYPHEHALDSFNLEGELLNPYEQFYEGFGY